MKTIASAAALTIVIGLLFDLSLGVGNIVLLVLVVACLVLPIERASS